MVADRVDAGLVVSQGRAAVRQVSLSIRARLQGAERNTSLLIRRCATGRAYD